MGVTVSDEMVRVAAEVLRRPDRDTRASELTDAEIAEVLAEALGVMWKQGDDIYTIDGCVLAFWRSKEPDLEGEFDVTHFDGEVWVNPEDEHDAFRAPDYVMAIPAPPTRPSGEA